MQHYYGHTVLKYISSDEIVFVLKKQSKIDTCH